MTEGYDQRNNSDDPYPWLHEFLCEYVDGTMNPAQREAFEQYVRANPALARHIEQLCRARTLLCRHGCRLNASPDVRERLQRRLAGEVMRTQAPVPAAFTQRLGSAAALTSVMAVVVLVGMLGGALFIPADEGEGATPSEQRTQLDGRRVDRLPLPSVQLATARVDLPASPYYHPYQRPTTPGRYAPPLVAGDTLYGDALNSAPAP